jgi:hypothetical protein
MGGIPWGRYNGCMSWTLATLLLPALAQSCRAGADHLGGAWRRSFTSPSSVAPSHSLLNCGRCHSSAVHIRQAPCRLTKKSDELLPTPQPAPNTLHTMSASNIRVFVQWKNATVFAGEDVECTITFKNVALPEGRGRSPGRGQNGFAPGGERLRKLPPVHSSTRPSVSRNSSFASQIAPPSHLRGHRPALSLSTPTNAGERRPPASQTGAFGNNAGGHSHGRSLSIISLGTDAATEVNREKSATPGRPMRGHARSGSLQIVPGRPNSYPGTVRGDCKLRELT